MMSRRARNISGLVGLLAVYHSLLYAGSPGSSALNFLKIPAGVRAVGMGEAYCGLAEGLDAVRYNPAGISQAGYQQLSASHIMWFDDIGYSFVGYLHPSENSGAFAGSLYYLSKDGIPGYNSAGAPTNKKWDVSDMLCVLSYGRKLSVFSGGVSVKIIQESLADESASSYCFDAGLLYGLFPDMNFGISAGNIGGKVNYISGGEEIPLIIRTGISYRIFPFGDDITLNLDYNFPSDNDGYVCAGGEYSFSDNFSLRAGFVGSKDMISKALRFGFGFGRRNVHFDYAFAPSEILEDTHRAGLTIRFGRIFRRELVTGSALFCRSGEKYFRRGDLSNAIKEFDSALKINSEDRRAKEGMLKVKTELADIKHGKEIREYMKAGKKFYRGLKLREAKEEFEKVLTIFPEHQKANAYIVKIARKLKQAEIDAAVQTLLDEGKDAFQTGDLAVSEIKFEKVLEILPGNYDALDYLEKIQLKKEIEEDKREKAPAPPVPSVSPDAGAFSKITAVDFSEEENRTYISFVVSSEITEKQIKIMLGKQVVAEGEIIECTDKTGKEFYYDAVLTKRTEELKEGEQVLILENTKDEGHYFNKATELFQQGKYKEAVREWQKVLEINPGHKLSKQKIKMAEEKLRSKKAPKEK